jgi:hypothetical protein
MQPKRNRPGGNGPATQQVGETEASLAHNSDIAADLRRRRAASWRCVPIDGRQDPLDALARVPRSRQSTIAARRAWAHLRDCDLMDADGWLEAVLAEGVAG